jgi:hypothetical protein
MAGFSEYVVFADESGDHGAVSKDFPVFVLAFCIFEKQRYIAEVQTALSAFKHRWFGHDAVVMHERDLRKRKAPFEFLLAAEKREKFMGELGEIIEAMPFTIVAVVLHKDKITERKDKAKWPVYETAMRFGLERVGIFLEEQQQPKDSITHVIFEQRGKVEDLEVENEFRRRAAEFVGWKGGGGKVDIVFAPKAANHCGHQIADLIARPIGQMVLRPDQPNRTYDIISKKFRRSTGGKIMGYGLKVFPP